jgi:hypothetical protein
LTAPGQVDYFSICLPEEAHSRSLETPDQEDVIFAIGGNTVNDIFIAY